MEFFFILFLICQVAVERDSNWIILGIVLFAASDLFLAMVFCEEQSIGTTKKGNQRSRKQRLGEDCFFAVNSRSRDWFVLQKHGEIK